MKSDFIKLFQDSLNVTIKKLVEEDAEFGAPVPVEGSAKTGDVTIVVGIVGSRIEGQLSISISEKNAITLAGKMMGKELTVMGVDAKSALSEFGNILSATATYRLTNAGIDCDITTPSLVTGHSMNMNIKRGSRAVTIPVKMDSCSMNMTLSIGERAA